MISVGMLHDRKNPKDVKKAYAFAAVAKMEGIEFFYFTYTSVDFVTEKIAGWVYEQGKWSQREMEIPHVIINSKNPKTQEQYVIYRKLKEVTIFTSYSVGNKMKVYKKILKGKKFAHFLIPSIPIKTGKEALEFFEEHSQLVLKPIVGNHGKKILFVKKSRSGYEITEGIRKYILEEREAVLYLNQKLGEDEYLLQPFIECKTKSGLTYDFRLHVQKNGRGKWEITLIYPRISGNVKMISNISSGGYRGELIPFLKEEFGDEGERIKHKLEDFALSFVSHFDTLYRYSFDELGIDVALDSKQRIWIFEVNWRPGSKHREFEVAKRLISYCRYLALKQ